MQYMMWLGHSWSAAVCGWTTSLNAVTPFFMIEMGTEQTFNVLYNVYFCSQKLNNFQYFTHSVFCVVYFITRTYCYYHTVRCHTYARCCWIVICIYLPWLKVNKLAIQAVTATHLHTLWHISWYMSTSVQSFAGSILRIIENIGTV